MATAVLKVARTPSGYLLRVEGRGTMHESLVAHQFALASLGEESGELIFDLSACEYLDSTFLGCLFDLHRRFDQEQATRVSLLSPSERCRQSIRSVKLDSVLKVVDGPAPTVSDSVTLSTTPTGAGELGEHILQCHRQLGRLGPENEKEFGSIADRLERELASE